MSEPKVAIFSLLRDRADRVASYKEKIYAMNYTNWTVSAIEGDSIDHTYTLLKEWESQESRVRVFKLDLHKPLYGSVVHPERFEILGRCNDYALNDLAEDESIDYFFYLQMDLRFWEPTTIIQDLIANNKDVVSGLIWGNGIMYDTWGHSFLNGTNFPGQTPKWYKDSGYTETFEVKTAGSFLLIKGEVIRAGARFGIKEDVKGFCNHARSLGFTIWCDPNISADHT